MRQRPFILRETIIVYSVDLVIQALKQATIQERHVAIGKAQELLCTTRHKVAFIAHQIVHIKIPVLATLYNLGTETTIVCLILALSYNRTIEHGKEEVLQYQPVIFTFLRIVQKTLAVVWVEVLYKMLPNVILIKEFIWNQMLLLQEPDENQTGNQSDASLMIESLVILIGTQIVRETSHLHRPSIPIAQFTIKFLGKQLVGEHHHPMLVQLLKRSTNLVTQSLQDIKMSTVWMLAIDIAEDAYLSQLLATSIAPLLRILHSLASRK